MATARASVGELSQLECRVLESAVSLCLEDLLSRYSGSIDPLDPHRQEEAIGEMVSTLIACMPFPVEGRPQEEVEEEATAARATADLGKFDQAEPIWRLNVLRRRLMNGYDHMADLETDFEELKWILERAIEIASDKGKRIEESDLLRFYSQLNARS